MAFAPSGYAPQDDFFARDRLASLVLVAAIHALIGWALIAGLRVTLARSAPQTPLLLVELDPPRTTVLPPPPREHPRVGRREGAAAPAALRARATELVAPVPVIALPVAPPIVVAPVAGPGAEASTGAAPMPGRGSGAGGLGTGTGSGAAGDGDGAGGGVTPLRWRSGELEDDDLPRWVPEGFSGTVHLRFTVGVKGRVTDCTVTRSSGIADLDALTCRLIVKRLRYRPTLDRNGRPVPDVVTGEQTWTAYRRPAGDGS